MDELLEKLGIDWRLLIAQLVNFVVLFFVLRRYLYRPVLEMLARRAEHIAGGLRDADTARDRLARIEQERTELLRRAELERQGVLERAAPEAEALRHDRLAAAEEESVARVTRAEREAERLREEMLTAVRAEIGDLVLAISRKATAERLTPTQHKQLIADAVEELRAAPWS
ncbi:F0F1 ATP synthase subunit B [Candidatus Uhrbacteria bacterium]|nr:F0F1 ATP synthase subunit B [Candidatus Uhrbacteria bacterium]